MRSSGSHRWAIGLGLAACLAATALIALAWTAARALEEGRDLALDGRLLRLAHRVEAALRDAGPEGATEILASAFAEESSWVSALALDHAGLEWVGLVGDRSRVVSGIEPNRRVEMSLGRSWGGGPMSPGGGPGAGPGGGHGGGRFGARPPARRDLGVWIVPAALAASMTERALVPAAGLVGAALVVLTLLAGRQSRRERVRELELVERRRLEALGRAGAGLAHQLRNPLATVKGTCQLLLEEGVESPSPRLERALGEVVRMERLLTELLDYARPPAPEPQTVDLAALLAELAASGGPLRITCAAGATVRADPEHLREILANLIDNAHAASPANEAVEVRAQRRGAAVEVEVADRGDGPGEEPELWFEPYATGRTEGTGLGLPIARALAAANRGSLTLQARSGGGAVARLSLPSAESVG